MFSIKREKALFFILFFSFFLLYPRRSHCKRKILVELTSPSSPAELWSPTQKKNKHWAHITGKLLDCISGLCGIAHQSVVKVEGISRTLSRIQCRNPYSKNGENWDVLLHLEQFFWHNFSHVKGKSWCLLPSPGPFWCSSYWSILQHSVRLICLHWA